METPKGMAIWSEAGGVGIHTLLCSHVRSERMEAEERVLLLFLWGRGVSSPRKGGRCLSHPGKVTPGCFIPIPLHHIGSKNDASRWKYDWGLETEMGEGSTSEPSPQPLWESGSPGRENGVPMPQPSHSSQGGPPGPRAEVGVTS